MAFKKNRSKQDIHDNPIDLFRSLSRRKFPTEMPHQRAIIESYVKESLKSKDVALQLPTGSGKTLVGTLIGEWRRRKFNQRVVFLCPTRQLVNQTVEQCREKYGMDVLGFTGSKKIYDPSAIAEYRQCRKIAITTYQSVFNTRPFFDDADTIIIDDAHAAENYISKMWSLELSITDEKSKAALQAVSNILKPHIGRLDFSILNGDAKSFADVGWVDKIPTPILCKIADPLTEALDVHAHGTDLSFSWQLLREHLMACHVYISYGEILIRPLVPPTWTLSAFEAAKHRIYMSATLGEGGDLERLTGREVVSRLAAPSGYNLESVGRRFFMFPGMSLQEGDIQDLRLELIKKSGRAVILTPSKKVALKAIEKIEEIGFPFFSAEDIEVSKTAFTQEKNAVAVLAGRYDGLDFPDDECRMLCVDNLPKASNLQERFFSRKMGAELLLSSRIQTRVIQAIGRCTRSLQDRSAVFISGEELQDYLTDKNLRQHLLPELQAEIDFGVEQSIGVSSSDFKDNYEIFLENGDDWHEVDGNIISEIKTMQKIDFPASAELAASVRNEVRYQKAIWASDYEKALEEARSVLGHLSAPELRGYRALWHYLAGSAAFLLSLQGNRAATETSKDQFRSAIKAATNLPWTSTLLPKNELNDAEISTDREIALQVERIEGKLIKLGMSHDRKFAELEREILQGINGTKNFERAQVLLGDLLGFSSGNDESDAAPDPWWLGETTGIVFEDYVGAEQETLGANKARQAASHPRWLKEKVAAAEGCDILSVLVGPVTKAHEGAFPHLTTVSYWSTEDFRAWAFNALATLRQLKTQLHREGDLAWRADAAKTLDQSGLSMAAIRSERLNNIAAEMLSPA
ncbi:Replicative superfamily II helicase [Paracoccus alcaliphilus]|uniref:Replicative superfamily II helicase n=3 Tax=Paracoccus alcaliphilus TaxID=34002 RepID=A0A1H8NMB0_9RHOB|nr:DEAD/DEAH box helicase family protein [Paracoccus alcaliphilus]SEO30734.1 Replicative superfamily II helicase [Paracoccus alcaliphilus]